MLLYDECQVNHTITEGASEKMTEITNELMLVVAAMLTPEGAAQAANTSISTIWRAVRTGKLPSYRRGRRDTRFLPADVAAFKASRSRAA
jgi:excisionase family DNA binding protein